MATEEFISWNSLERNDRTAIRWILRGEDRGRRESKNSET